MTRSWRAGSARPLLTVAAVPATAGWRSKPWIDDRVRRALFLVPATTIFLGVFVAPLSFFFVISFWSVKLFRVSPDFTGKNYATVYQEYLVVALKTLGIGLSVGIATTVFAFLFAYAVRFKVGRFDTLLIFVTLVTLFGGYLVKIYAWKSILGTTGILNSALIGLGIVDEPVRAFIYNPGAVIVALVHFLLPLAVLPVYASMRNIQEITLEAARDLGASGPRVIFGIVVPQCRPGLLAAFTFSFLIAAGDFVTPSFLGGTSASMIGQFIAMAFSIRFDWPLGAAMAFSVLAASFVVVLVAWALLRPGRR